MSDERQRRVPRTRTTQRFLHLVAAAGITTYVYFTPDPGSLMTFGIRWVALPSLALSGLAMWLWPRIRRRLGMARTPSPARVSRP